MKEEELRLCQIQEWYPLFKRNSIPTLFHPLPDNFISSLLGESPAAGEPQLPFLLPLTSSGRDPFPRTSPSSLDSDPSSSLIEFDSDSDSDSENLAPSFPALESAVNQSISALGGSVFPKLNWSSPKDAAWIAADGSLRCTSFAEIALLLHSSDRAVHDLCHAASSCSDHLPSSSSPSFSFFLALRKFYPALRPELEFRCFVRRRHLIGISQREVTAFYPSLLDRRRELRRLVEDFFDEVVGNRFGLEDYCFDVYVTVDGRVKVLDFNPWGAFTLPLLFTW
ncbi:cell division cycle protein 123 homolog, partial [Phalaenopsis equestris]|uniref:cell division cycle protein 123 homolog n=1 Tax=Phalaenopsis equestris TaxID=78828 RepID=UPI0009E64F45